MEYKNILAYRFTVKEDLLDPAVPGNEGFCHNDGKTFFSEDEKCLPKGLLDLSYCYNGIDPIYEFKKKKLKSLTFWLG